MSVIRRRVPRAAAALAAIALAAVGAWAWQRAGSAPVVEVITAASQAGEIAKTPAARSDRQVGAESSNAAVGIPSTGAAVGSEPVVPPTQSAAASVQPRREAAAQGSGGGDAATGSTDSSGGGGGSSDAGIPFTYWDGDVQRTVRLQAPVPPLGGGAAGASGRSAAGALAGADLVFRSQSGREMQLPGGVTLLLDPEWTSGQVEAFLRRNGIARSRAEPLGWIENGFLVETASGLASLRLANALAPHDGVIVSSPNWASEFVTE